MRSSENKFNNAGFWARSAASIIDSTLIAVVTMPLLAIFSKEIGNSKAIDSVELIRSLSGAGDLSVLSSITQLGFASNAYSTTDAVIQWVLPLVATILFWVYRSATPGKIALSLSVVDMNTGMPISFTQSIIRYIGYFVSIIPLGFGFLWVVFDSKKQGFHDKIAKTIVIKDIR